jgi:glycosyltransferase involved in cell wall biosynthesis
MARLAVVFAGDLQDATAWSGIPKNLADALEGLDHNVVRVSAKPSLRIVGRLRRAGGTESLLSAVNTVVGRTRLLASGRFDGVVQVGTNFTLRTRVPTAMFEDMTVVQHERYNDEWFMRFPADARRAWSARQRRAYANATACCMLSQWAAQSVINDYGVPPEKVHVVGVGGNHLISPPVDRDFSIPRFLIVARDWKRKNVPAVIAAFGRIYAECPDATLDVVGPYHGGAGAGVTLHGPLSLGSPEEREVMEALFRRATCYVMPSTHEAAGIVFVEAANAGLPSIAGSVGGCSEVVGDGGILVEPSDFGQLVAAMRRLADPEIARDFGERARRHVQWYRWPEVAKRIVRALGLRPALDDHARA